MNAKLMALTVQAQTPPPIGGKQAIPGEGREAARKIAQEFESVFLSTMLEQMFSGLEVKPPFGGGHGEKVYRSLLVGEYAKHMAGSGGIGIADNVYREILAAQEDSRQ